LDTTTVGYNYSWVQLQSGSASVRYSTAAESKVQQGIYSYSQVQLKKRKIIAMYSKMGVYCTLSTISYSCTIKYRYGEEQKQLQQTLLRLKITGLKKRHVNRKFRYLNHYQSRNLARVA
jgi:hypothetical protein